MEKSVSSYSSARLDLCECAYYRGGHGASANKQSTIGAPPREGRVALTTHTHMADGQSLQMCPSHYHDAGISHPRRSPWIRTVHRPSSLPVTLSRVTHETGI
jgi:hypothetical protein